MAVALLNWNGKHLLHQFLPSVVKFSKGAGIYVIDNASEDDSIDFLRSTYPEIKIIKLKANLGYAGGYNEGIKHISEPLVCCLNTDIEVTNNWLNPILACFNSNPNIAIAQPKLLDYRAKNKFEYAGAAGGFIDRLGYPYCRGRIVNSIEEDLGQYNDSRTIFWASGACFFIRKKVFETLGGFDPDFFAHMEEIDLCWRAFNAGYKTAYIGYSTVYHVGGSTLSNRNAKKTYLNFRNSLYTLIKNSPYPLLLILSRLVLDGLAGLNFIIKFQVRHAFAIIKAHLSFYRHLPIMIKKRRQTAQKSKDYYESSSIIWQYYVRKRKNF